MKTVTRFRILLSALAMVLLGEVVYADGESEAPATEPDQRTVQSDRLDLDASSVTGNRELPKVMYIVPWKESGVSDLSGRPANSLLDEILAPLDRDVFRRQIDYYDQLQAMSAKDIDSIDK